MFLELAEVLDCPDCRASAGLVAFVDRAERRRVIEGRLGCPLCEIEVPIRRGTMRFDLSGASRRASGAALAAPPRPDPPLPGPASETALRIAALLGVTDRAGQVVLLGPGLAGHAGWLARMGDRLEVVAWLDARGDPAALGVADPEVGVDPLLGASPDGWPVRSGALHGVALSGPLALHLTEIERCVRPGARLFVAEPTSEDLESLSESGFRELAADPTAWVGERR
ncbi:hypothetical protein [Candidatus Palauibacter sp.]|uniref:hypothetical protein n=1 Tax=Candidatus Palauibacter sp. TaxID=3101350 RepID=UPI003CC68C60